LIKGYKLGNTELAVPDSRDLPVRPISIPKNIRAVADAQGANVTWDKVYGARGYDVQSRVLGEYTWILWPNQQVNWFYAAWPGGKVIEIEFKVRMNNGYSEKEGEWSRVIGTCRAWSSLTSEEKWDWRWWYRRFSPCSWRWNPNPRSADCQKFKLKVRKPPFPTWNNHNSQIKLFFAKKISSVGPSTNLLP